MQRTERKRICVCKQSFKIDNWENAASKVKYTRV